MTIVAFVAFPLQQVALPLWRHMPGNPGRRLWQAIASERDDKTRPTSIILPSVLYLFRSVKTAVTQSVISAQAGISEPMTVTAEQLTLARRADSLRWHDENGRYRPKTGLSKISQSSGLQRFVGHANLPYEACLTCASALCSSGVLRTAKSRNLGSGDGNSACRHEVGSRRGYNYGTDPGRDSRDQGRSDYQSKLPCR